MRYHPARRCVAMVIGALGAVLIAGCGAPAGGGGETSAQQQSADASRATTVVPDLLGLDVAVIDKTAAEAGVAPVVEYVAAAGPAGRVVRIDPAPGTVVPLGSPINVSVAGEPGNTLDEIIAANRRSFVGLGVDQDGTLVVAVADTAGSDVALQRLQPALVGRNHRVVRCGTSWVELARVAAEVTRRPDLRARSAGFTTTIDPAACAVRVQGDVPTDITAALRSAYAALIVVESGEAAQRAPRT